MSDTKFYDGGPAFPHTDLNQPLKSPAITGMTMLDWFAGQALVGWLAGPCQGDVLDDYDANTEEFAQHQKLVAETCYGYAESMVAEKRRREGRHGL